jgi:hypothetical protein
MFPARTRLLVPGALIVIGALAFLLLSNPSLPLHPARMVRESQDRKRGAAPSDSVLGTSGHPGATAAKAWKPPGGDPVTGYRQAKNAPAQVRKDLISNFIALGHDRNPYLLIEALSDADPGVRLFAVESVASLPVGEATAVLAAASSNPDPDVREMAWSLTAPYPVESKVTIFSGALREGDETIVREAFREMGIRPEKALFEMMLTEAVRPGADAARQNLLLEELKNWLVPGGGDVPGFDSATAMALWWKANLVHYDQHLLRTDVNP